MHRAGYAALGLDYAYVPFECRDLAGALAGMRALGIRGFGISMPFKQEILPLLDALDPLAERIGAVNTVVNDDGAVPCSSAALRPDCPFAPELLRTGVT